MLSNDSAKKPSVHPSENLKACPEFIEGTNGGAVEIIGGFPFMLSPVEAFLGLLRRISD
jgi:hypothetical protein